MTSFSTKHIAYKPMPDNGAWWYLNYDLGFANGTVTVSVDIKLTGVDNAEKKAAWLAGIKELWNERAFLSDGSNLYDVKFNVRYVTSGQDYTVAVHQGSSADHFNMLNWYVLSDWGEGHDDVLASHEFGHMIGNFDEYDGGGTHGRITTGTLMSDLMPAGFDHYFDGIQKQTEKYGFSGHNALSTVLAVRGYDGPDTWYGANDKMDGYYGDAGDDSIGGLGGNDFLDGGADNDTIFGGTGHDRLFGQSGTDWLLGDAGNDTLTGGSGNDTMDGGANKDRFVFNAKLSASTNVDLILSFSHADDTIALENAIFTKLGSKIESGEFYAGKTATRAHDGSDRIIYNKTSGWLYYDDDGNKKHGHAAVHFATLDTHPGNVNYTDFIVV